MKQEPLRCTDPQGFERPPAPDATDEDILAWLRHCDGCRFHALQDLEEDLHMDVLLHAAARDLDVRPRPKRRDRPPREKLWFERRLVRAVLAACCIVVLWPFVLERMSRTSGDVEELALAARQRTPAFTVQNIADTRAGHLYLARRTADGGGLSEQGTDGALYVAAPRERGTVLRITNPENGRWIEARVERRTFGERELLLSGGAADSLGVEDARVLFVEVLQAPTPSGLAP